jgi:hypothetical protein
MTSLYGITQVIDAAHPIVPPKCWSIIGSGRGLRDRGMLKVKRQPNANNTNENTDLTSDKSGGVSF